MGSPVSAADLIQPRTVILPTLVMVSIRLRTPMLSHDWNLSLMEQARRSAG